MSNELVSIIVPVYNVKEYLEQCITSILNQTYTNLEIILVDDGSTDGSGDICDYFARQDARVKILHQNNQGLTKARKNGAKLITGKYLGFVDSDDYIDHDLYQRLMDIQDGYDLIIQKWFRSEKEGNLPRGDRIATGIYVSEPDMDFILRHMINVSIPGGAINLKSGFSPFVWNKLYRTEIAQTVFTEIDEGLRMVEDCDFTYRYLLKCQSVFVSEVRGYHYRIRPDSICHAVDTDCSFLMNICRLYNGLLPTIRTHPKADILVAELQIKIAAMLKKVPSRMGFPFTAQNKTYIFPFVNQLHGKCVALYGAGYLGRLYWRQIKQWDVCAITAWVDCKWMEFRREGLEVYPIADLSEREFDFVVMALFDASEAEIARNQLLMQGIQAEKILWKEPLSI